MAGHPTNGNGWAQRYAVIIQTVTVLAIFCAGAWAVVGSPTLENIRSIQKDINNDHAWTQKQDVQILKLEDHIKRIDQRHEVHVVPRSENDIRLSQIVNQQTLLGERLNELRKQTLSSVTVGDDLKRLNAEISDLRRRLEDRK